LNDNSGFDSLDFVEDISLSASEIPGKIEGDYEKIVKISLIAKEVYSEIEPGVFYEYWTYNESVPGPLIRVREGDIIELTLKNDESSKNPHAIDLHAVTGPGGGAVLTQVVPGETKSFRFKALNPGLFVYHCAMPYIPEHISNGMYGMILVEPKEGLSEVDKEFYVVQGELYTTGDGELIKFDSDGVNLENPNYVVFNGKKAALTENPLKANVGDRVRIYFGNAGVSLISSFHVIGEIFDTVYPEASLSVTYKDIQTTIVPAGGATIVEFDLEVPGNYLLVDHALARLEKGALGIIWVEGKESNDIYSRL
tara:strand:- start:241 stop:1170 length:930 start_codon:yes stop_codon:yes gene_type:complete